jgi:hypothetical protein
VTVKVVVVLLVVMAAVVLALAVLNPMMMIMETIASTGCLKKQILATLLHTEKLTHEEIERNK